MNTFLLICTISCIILLLFIAYAFVNNIDTNPINEAGGTGSVSNIDESTMLDGTLTENETLKN